jgi:hypothetical protein
VHAAVTREGRLTRLPEEIIEKIAKFATVYEPTNNPQE